MEIALTDLDLLLRLAQNWKKMHFFDNLTTITQEGNMETRKMTPFFYLVFPFQLFMTFIFVFGNSQNLFSFGCPLWSILVRKIRQFRVKANIMLF